MTSITPEVLKAHPKTLATLRMSTAPPIAKGCPVTAGHR
ncbi:XamI family restriction endonuclease [Streptomyces albidoflavus]